MDIDESMRDRLLRRMAAGEDVSEEASALLAQAAEADPQVGLMMQALTRTRPTMASEAEHEDVSAEEMRPIAVLQDEGTRRLRVLCRRMFRELEELRARNDALAAALGACHLCWGEDFECLECEGNGRPGWARPDRALLRDLAGPALARLRRDQETRRARRAASTNAQPQPNRG